MKTLNFLPKLIRDKIPELLKKQKKNFITRKSKNKKEFLEELIDIEELILTFLEYLKVSQEKFEKMRCARKK